MQWIDPCGEEISMETGKDKRRDDSDPAYVSLVDGLWTKDKGLEISVKKAFALTQNQRGSPS